MKLMGSMLISALIIFPALTSMRLFKTFKSVVVSSVAVSSVCFVAGMVVSYLFDLPTGASIVLMNTVLFLIFSVIKATKR
jgi:zinc transport system permease protein